MGVTAAVTGCPPRDEGLARVFRSLYSESEPSSSSSSIMTCLPLLREAAVDWAGARLRAAGARLGVVVGAGAGEGL